MTWLKNQKKLDEQVIYIYNEDEDNYIKADTSSHLYKFESKGNEIMIYKSKYTYDDLEELLGSLQDKKL